MRMVKQFKNNRGEVIFEGLSRTEIENIVALVNLYLKDEVLGGHWPTDEKVKQFIFEDGPAMQSIRIPWEEARAETNRKIAEPNPNASRPTENHISKETE